MPAVKKNITIEQGATFKLVLTWKDSKSRPINLTGYSARLQVRAALGDAAVLIDASTANGKIVLGTTNGLITVTLTDEETQALTFQSGVYDLKVTPPDGASVRLMQGSVTLSLGVTA